MGDERKLGAEGTRGVGAEVREVGGFLMCETPRLKLMFSAEKKQSLVGTLRLENPATKRFYMDRFNLALAPRRKAFIKEAVAKIELSFGEIESFLDEFVEHLTNKDYKNESCRLTQAEIPEAQRQRGESFLKNRNWKEELLDDFRLLGCVGEETNLLTCYLVATSRLLDEPLSGIITSQAGSGKSQILNAVLSLMPPEEKIELARMTPTALYYMPQDRLKHKVIAIGEEAGAAGASYSIRSLISDGKLTLAVTSRDPKTGRLITEERYCEGPAAVLSTTTVPQMDEETWLRMLRLSTNESVAQTRAVMQSQYWKKTEEGFKWQAAAERVRQKHHAAQKLLRPVEVLNPFAKEMKFRWDLLRARRENQKYLRLIYTIALLRQQQKEIKQLTVIANEPPMAYIEVDLDDIELANTLAEEILVKTMDELTPSARNLLIEIYKMVQGRSITDAVKPAEVRFTRRDIREFSRWSDFQIRNYLKELEELEYLKSHRGSQGSSYLYELVYEGDPSDRGARIGLVDVARLREKSQGNGNGSKLKERLTSFIGLGSDSARDELSTTLR